MFTTAVKTLHPSPTDSCPLWLNNATIAALPTKCSRHNTPSRAHSLTKVIRSCISGGDEYVVVSASAKKKKNKQQLSSPPTFHPTTHPTPTPTHQPESASSASHFLDMF